MTKFTDTPRGALLRELYNSLQDGKYRSLVGIIEETIIALENEIEDRRQNEKNQEKLILYIISTLSPPNNESPKEHYLRCLSWLKEYKEIQ
jgi:hypothetical protein